MSSEPETTTTRPQEEAAADPAAAAPAVDAAEKEPFTAAAPRDPAASGAGETSFADAQAPPVGERSVPEPAAEEPDPAAEARKYLELAQRTQADFDNFRKRAARDAAAAADRGV
ncbi:MAG TPA: hypothetical protein VF533_09895, partial [Solirubrobacteraceae bacterium]